MKKFRRYIFDHIIQLGILVLLPLCAWLSCSNIRRLAKFGACLLAPFLRSRIRIIEANLALAFPELSVQQRHSLARRNLAYMLELGLDFLQLLQNPEAVVSKIDLESFQQALQLTQGPALWCIPHLGNWEILAQGFPLTGFPAVAVAEKLRNPKLNQLIQRARSLNGLTIIEKKGAARGVLQALKQKKQVGILIDQNISPRQGGRFVRFFGLPAPGSRLPATIARRLQVPVLIAANIKQANGTFALKIERLPQAISDYQDDMELLQDIILATEKLIKRYPEQYVWMYQRWRYLPANASAKQKQLFPFYANHDKYECPELMLPKLPEELNNETKT